MLQYLNVTACPKCNNSTIVKEEIKHSGQEIMIHSNGKRWEERQFACGMRLEYSANSSMVHILQGYQCKNDPDLIKETQESIQLIEEIIQFVNETETTRTVLREDILRELNNRKSNYEYRLKGRV